MSRASTFRKADLQRALKAAREAGWEAGEVVIAPTGEIRLRRARSQEPTTPDVEDEISRWAANNG